MLIIGFLFNKILNCFQSWLIIKIKQNTRKEEKKILFKKKIIVNSFYSLKRLLFKHIKSYILKAVFETKKLLFLLFYYHCHFEVNGQKSD